LAARLYQLSAMFSVRGELQSKTCRSAIALGVLAVATVALALATPASAATFSVANRLGRRPHTLGHRRGRRRPSWRRSADVIEAYER
jgi:hypothetical protein